MNDGRNERHELGQAFSLWLDLVRFAAALSVAIVHASHPAYGGGWFRFETLALEAVMVFFVLSGLVIAYAADRKEPTLDVFAARRLGRLWSVLIPALVLTYVADWIGLSFDRAPYDAMSEWIVPDLAVWRLLPSAVFVNEIWFSSIAPLSNAPAWSLGFEFWYYAMFGAAWYLPGKARWVVAAALAAIAGPRLLLLMPLWLLGCGVYWLGCRRRLPEAWGWALALVPVLIILFAKEMKWHFLLIGTGHAWLGPQWKFAQPFLWNYAVGLAVALNFYGMWSIQHRITWLLAPAARLIRWGSSISFSIYLMHAPLMLAISAALYKYPVGPTRTLLTIGVALGLCVALGMIFERQRFALSALLLRLIQAFQPARTQPRPTSSA